MPNAVIHDGKIYLLDHSPSGGEQLQAPDLSSQIKELGANVVPSSFPIKNGGAAKELSKENPNLHIQRSRYGLDGTDYNNVHLLQINPPQGVAPEKFVAALNSYEPKKGSYTNPHLADELKQSHAKTESLKAQQRAESISNISGKDPHKTVIELIQHNMDALGRGHPEYATVYDPTTGTFRVTHKENESVLSVKPSVPNPEYPDQLRLEVSIEDSSARAKAALQPLYSRLPLLGKDNHHIQNLGALLEGVVPSTKPTDIQSLLKNPREGQKEIKENISVQVTADTASRAITARNKAAGAQKAVNIFLNEAAERIAKERRPLPQNPSPSPETTVPHATSPERHTLTEESTTAPTTKEPDEAALHQPDNPPHTEPANTAPQTPQSPQPPTEAARPAYSHTPTHTANVLIMMGDPVHTGNGSSIRLDHLSSGQIDAYKQTLEHLKISFEDKTSSLGGGRFLHLDSEAASRLTTAQNVAKSQVITDQKQRAALTLLGAHAEKMPDGSTRLPNPDHHSEHVTRALETLGIPYSTSTTTGAITLSQKETNTFETMKQHAANFVRQHATALHPSSAASGPTSSQQSSSAPSAGGAPTTNAQGAQTSSSSPSAPPQGPRANGGLQNQPHPSDGQAVTMGSLALKPEPVAPLDLQPNPTKQVVDPVKATPAANVANPPTSTATATPPPAPSKAPTTSPAAESAHTGNKPSTLGKVGAAVGKTELGLNAAAQAAQGNIVGAATTVAEGVATNVAVGKASETAAKLLAKQGLKSAGVIVGAAATIGFGTATVIDKAKEGRYAAAAIEGATVLGEAAGNLLPGGVVGAGLRETFRAAVKHTIGEKYAPEKSGLRQAAELAADVGSKIVAQNQFKSMPTTKLREAIAHDETLPKTVAINGKSVALTEALDDKAFRTKFIDNLEKAEAKGHDLGAQIAMIKAYDNKLAVPPPHVAAAQKPSPHVQMYGV